MSPTTDPVRMHRRSRIEAAADVPADVIERVIDAWGAHWSTVRIRMDGPGAVAEVFRAPEIIELVANVTVETPVASMGCTFSVDPVGEALSGRARYRVTCHTHGVVVHEGTTGPAHWMKDHERSVEEG